MAAAQPIRYWNRELQKEEVERVYGDKSLRWVYESAAGRALADRTLSKRWLSRAYGAYQSSALSRSKIARFVERFGIDMSEFEDPGFGSFNEFFIRRFKAGKRPFVEDPKAFAAPCEARYLAFERAELSRVYPVKGEFLTPAAILGDAARAAAFEGGPMLLARLCPVDYHRFHYPDDGEVIEHYRLGGRLHSVNPVALRARGDIFCSNERQVTLLKTQGLGKLAYVEVGAMMVGRIVQMHEMRPGAKFRRGEEKGCFLFGASTVIVFGETGAWKPDADLLDQTERRLETFVKLGTRVGGAP